MRAAPALFRSTVVSLGAFLLAFTGLGLLATLLPARFTLLLAALIAVWIALSLEGGWVVLPLLFARTAVDSIMDLFVLFAGTPLEMNLAGALNSFTLGLAVAFALRRRLIRDPAGHSHEALGIPGAWWYIAWLLIALGGLGASIAPLETVKEWVRLASGPALFVLVRPLAAQTTRRSHLVWVIFLAALTPLVLEFYQLVTGTGYFFVGLVDTAYAFRAQGTFGHPAILASYLMLVVALAGALWLVPQSVRPTSAGDETLAYRSVPRRLPPLMGAAAGLGLILTLARAQWLGLLVVVVVLLAVRRPRWLWAGLLIPLAFVALPPLRERLTSADAQDSVTWRYELWQVAIGLIDLKRPFGLGLSTFPSYVEQVLPPRFVAPPHNDYLKALIETGFLGTVAFAGWQIAWLWAAARRGLADPFRLALFATVCGGLVVSLTDNYIQYTAVQWYVWVLAALAFVRPAAPDQPEQAIPGEEI